MIKLVNILNENQLLLESLSIYQIEILIKVERQANKVDIYNEIRAIDGVIVVKVEQNLYLNTLISENTEYSLLYMKYLVRNEPIEAIKEIKSRAIGTEKIPGLIKFIPRLKTLEKKTSL
jgi:hypothetical protein